MTILKTDVQTLAGGTDFDGLTDSTGLIDFLDLDFGITDIHRVPIAFTIGFNGSVATATLRLVQPGGVATAALIIRNLAATTSFTIDNCILVPRGGPAQAGVPWTLELVTTGSAADSSFIVQYGVGSV